jgi:LytS/YehU family sensor histidine kinase
MAAVMAAMVFRNSRLCVMIFIFYMVQATGTFVQLLTKNNKRNSKFSVCSGFSCSSNGTTIAIFLQFITEN